MYPVKHDHFRRSSQSSSSHDDRFTSRPSSSMLDSRISLDSSSPTTSSRSSCSNSSLLNSLNPYAQPSHITIDAIDDDYECVFDMRLSPTPPPCVAVERPCDQALPDMEACYHTAALSIGRTLRIESFGRSKIFGSVFQANGRLIHVVETFGYYQLGPQEMQMPNHLWRIASEVTGLRSFSIAILWATGQITDTMDPQSVIADVVALADMLTGVTAPQTRARLANAVHQPLQRTGQ